MSIEFDNSNLMYFKIFFESFWTGENLCRNK